MAKSTCSIDGCESPVRARGWCIQHYQRWRKHGDPEVRVVAWSRNGPVCAVEDCERAANRRGWCDPHYRRWKSLGDPLAGGEIQKRYGAAPCSVEGCGGNRSGGGMCGKHYQRLTKTGTLDEPRRNTVCTVDECTRKEAEHSGMCVTHLRRQRTRGTTDPQQLKGKMPCAVEECPNVCNGGWGWCMLHYTRYRKTGDPRKTPRDIRIDEENRTGTRVCVRCKRDRPMDQYQRDKRSLNRRIRECDECRHARFAKIYADAVHADAAARSRKTRSQYLMRRYGITADHYDEMNREQHGLCAVCETSEKALVVDHCHTSGAIRALLCNDCNLALGHINDSVEILNRLIKYVETHDRRPRDC